MSIYAKLWSSTWLDKFLPKEPNHPFMEWKTLEINLHL